MYQKHDQNILRVASSVAVQLVRPHVFMFSHEITELGMLFR